MAGRRQSHSAVPRGRHMDTSGRGSKRRPSVGDVRPCPGGFGACCPPGQDTGHEQESRHPRPSGPSRKTPQKSHTERQHPSKRARAAEILSTSPPNTSNPIPHGDSGGLRSCLPCARPRPSLFPGCEGGGNGSRGSESSASQQHRSKQPARRRHRRRDTV